ncbi:hypothetical protein FOZ60_017444, partial [Perkinsus olseni]
MSPQITLHIHRKYEEFGAYKSDLQFMQIIYKFMREVLGTNPCVTLQQLFSNGDHPLLVDMIRPSKGVNENVASQEEECLGTDCIEDPLPIEDARSPPVPSGLPVDADCLVKSMERLLVAVNSVDHKLDTLAEQVESRVGQLDARLRALELRLDSTPMKDMAVVSETGKESQETTMDEVDSPKEVLSDYDAVDEIIGRLDKHYEATQQMLEKSRALQMCSNVRRMEHHVLAVAMEATANDKYYNNLLWLEYLKRCKELVDTSLFTGRDLSKVLSALARAKQSIVDQNAAHARITEDIIAIAEKRILGASSSKISFTTPQQIAWVAFGVSRLSRLGAEQLASLARSFTELLTDNPNVRLSAKDCGMAIEAFRGGNADLLECLSARLYPSIHTYDFSEWKASIFPVLEERISELGPHEVCRLICSVKHAPELGESMAPLPASLERALSKRIVELKGEFSVADIAALIS